jgi:hypothetical protein
MWMRQNIHCIMSLVGVIHLFLECDMRLLRSNQQKTLIGHKKFSPKDIDGAFFFGVLLHLLSGLESSLL